MKAFEYLPVTRTHLITHERVEDVYVRADQVCFTPEAFKVLPRRKHLTDAECAAEYWRAEIDANGDWERTYPTHDEDHPLWERYLTSSKQSSVWHRFATTPHAFGGDS